MPDIPTLHDLESAFQRLQFQISLTLSQRLKIRLLGEFCSLLLLRKRLEINHSYYQEILADFPELINQESLEYQPLELLQSLLTTLVYLDASPEFFTTRRNFQKALEETRFRTAAAAFYVGDWSGGIQFIALGTDHPPLPDTFQNIDCIDQFIRHPQIQTLPDEQRDLIKGIQEEWHSKTRGSSHQEVWIPLVEKWEESPNQDIIVGTLYPLHLDMEERKKNRRKDLIFFNNHPIGLDDLVNYQAQDAIRAARTQHSLLRRSKTARYSVTFGFPASDYFYSGSSFGLGMSLLVLCDLERHSNLRYQHILSRKAAFTGGVDLHGEIRPVSDDSLGEKISAVFFSPLETFVLPNDNLKQGQKIVDSLKQKYPAKIFHLIGEKSIDPSLQKTKLVIRKKMPLMVWMKNHLTRNKVFQILSLLLFPLLLIWGVQDFLSDPNPAKYEIEGEAIRFYNNNGVFLWQIDLGFVPDGLAVTRQGNPRFKRLQISDFDGDGQNEVILGTAIKNRNYGGRLYFIETDGVIKWIYKDHPRLFFGGNEYTDTYATSFIYPYKHADSDAYDFYVSFTHRPWFPNQIMRFDVEGNVLNSFIHPGSLYDMELFDMDGDGEVELLVAGTNNRFNTAVLSILPSRAFSGSVPGSGDSSCVLDEGKVDPALAYIKFPRWGDYDFSGTNARSYVNDIYIDDERGFGVTTNISDKDETGSYIYHFSFDLQLDGLTLTDGYMSAYQKRTGQAFFEHFNRRDWLQSMTKIKLWQNGSWKMIDKSLK